MGIYIKHMKMPNSCVECPLYKESACDAFETLAPYTFKDNERASFCPLTEVAEPKTGKWIPCSERLPEDTGAYLVTCTNGNTKVGHFSTFDNRWSDAKATAWMPLPEPYREDGEA